MPAVAEAPISATLPLPTHLFLAGNTSQTVMQFNAATGKLNRFVEVYVHNGFAPIANLAEWRTILKENLATVQRAKRQLKVKKSDKQVAALYGLLQILSEAAEKAAKEYTKSTLKKRVNAFHLYDGLSFDF